jgi:isocitrate dehydrogenase
MELPINMNKLTPVTVAYGEGIGPEIMQATLCVLREAGATIEPQRIEIGLESYRRGILSGIHEDAWKLLSKNKVFLKGPTTTPSGAGLKSLAVNLRKTLSLYANVRPCISYAPAIPSRHPGMDIVVIHENEEDLYAGIEHCQVEEVAQGLKFTSRYGCEKVIRYAFEYALYNERRKVTCLAKPNILKLTDGLFQQVFNEIGAEYPTLEKQSQKVDIGFAKIATMPEDYDVIVTPSVYGDLLSDVTAQLAGSVGLAPSVSAGDNQAMFEAIHGSAPARANQDLVNPSGLLVSAMIMLSHIGQSEVAELIHHAWLCTLEDGIHTYDVFSERSSTKKIGTWEFALEVIKRLGRKPESCYRKLPALVKSPGLSVDPFQHRADKQIVGIDVFLEWREGSAAHLGEGLSHIQFDNLRLREISNRGVMVWPERHPETVCIGHWCCRFMATENGARMSPQQMITLMERITRAGFTIVKMETLCTFDGLPGFSSN